MCVDWVNMAGDFKLGGFVEQPDAKPLCEKKKRTMWLVEIREYLNPNSSHDRND